MRGWAMFAVCFPTAILAGTALFSVGASGGVSWIDGVFLVSSGICLGLAVVFFSRRLKRLGGEVRDPTGLGGGENDRL